MSSGIYGTALDRLRSFLQCRSQSVIIDGIQSELKQLTCGVPQGSVLGPIEFCLYMLTLGTILITTGQFPNTLKSAVVKPLLKKPTLDPHSMKNYRHVSNLPFLSTFMEKVTVKQMTAHMLKHDIFEELQSAYNTNHITETRLLKVFNDIMQTLIVDLVRFNFVGFVGCFRYY